jgi:hypothetical protein
MLFDSLQSLWSTVVISDLKTLFDLFIKLNHIQVCLAF